jgi:1,4-dihydroxy-2-naphthoate octaprenyltransferase
LVIVIATRRPAALIALVAVIPAVPLLRRVKSGAAGRDLIAALGMTGGLQLLFSILLAVGIAW